MKNSIIIPVILHALVFFTACSDNNEEALPQYTGKVKVISDDISSTTTWYSDTTYIIADHDFWVEGTLTIQPGTIIKFTSLGMNLTVSGTGTINATGTPTDSIIFTSIKDDYYGGDNNSDGTATSPKTGDWGGISCESNSNIFKYCKFLYGGGSSYKTTLEILSDNCLVEYCTFADNVGGKNGDFYNGALDTENAGINTTIKNNNFYNNTIPLSLNSLINIDNSNSFCKPGATSIKNTMNGIFIYDAGGINKAVTWAETEVPFVINDNDLWIESGGSLSLSNGVVLKFTPTSVIVITSGAVINNYGNCVFTSFKDDVRGGDTNGDGNATSPSYGDWGGIYDDANSQYFKWSTIFYDSH